MSLKIYSGTCLMCDIGIPTGELSFDGAELFTGDIVQLWHGNYLGTDLEEWMPNDGLTAIVSNQYKSYTDGTFELLDNNATPFTMGIRESGVQDNEWKVKLVKSHKDIIDGERFKSFGFNYRSTDAMLKERDK